MTTDVINGGEVDQEARAKRMLELAGAVRQLSDVVAATKKSCPPDEVTQAFREAADLIVEIRPYVGAKHDALCEKLVGDLVGLKIPPEPNLRVLAKALENRVEQDQQNRIVDARAAAAKAERKRRAEERQARLARKAQPPAAEGLTDASAVAVQLRDRDTTQSIGFADRDDPDFGEIIQRGEDGLPQTDEERTAVIEASMTPPAEILAAYGHAECDSVLPLGDCSQCQEERIDRERAAALARPTRPVPVRAAAPPEPVDIETLTDVELLRELAASLDGDADPFRRSAAVRLYDIAEELDHEPNYVFSVPDRAIAASQERTDDLRALFEAFEAFQLVVKARLETVENLVAGLDRTLMAHSASINGIRIRADAIEETGEWLGKRVDALEERNTTNLAELSDFGKRVDALEEALAGPPDEQAGEATTADEGSDEA